MQSKLSFRVSSPGHDAITRQPPITKQRLHTADLRWLARHPLPTEQRVTLPPERDAVRPADVTVRAECVTAQLPCKCDDPSPQQLQHHGSTDRWRFVQRDDD